MQPVITRFVIALRDWKPFFILIRKKAVPVTLTTAVLLGFLGVTVAINQHRSNVTETAEPTWGLPFPAGSTVRVGDEGLHAANWGQLGSYSISNFDVGGPSLDLGYGVTPASTGSVPAVSLAAGQVLWVDSVCHIVLIDHGNGWWVEYLHLDTSGVPIAKDESVQVGAIIGYPTTKFNTTCENGTSNFAHVHFAFIHLDPASNVRSYVSMAGKILCGFQVESNGNLLRLSDNQVFGPSNTFTVPQQCPTSSTQHGDIAGYVRDVGTGGPVSTADVKIAANGASESTKTDATGFYSFHTIPEGSVTITASAPGYGDTSISAQVLPNTSNRAPDIKLSQACISLVTHGPTLSLFQSLTSGAAHASSAVTGCNPTLPPSNSGCSSPPVPSSPRNNAAYPQSQDITLSWSTGCAESYAELWGSPYGTLNFGGWKSVTSIHIGQMWQGTYTWHVKGMSASGAQTGWSDSWTFSIGANTNPPSTGCAGSGGVTLYVDNNYSGTCHSFGPGEYADLSQYGLDQNVSSIRDANAAYHITFYDQKGLAGTPAYFDQDTSHMDGYWNDRARSMRIEVHGPAPSPTPSPTDDAGLSGQSASPTVHVGQQFAISFAMQNTGNTTWSDPGGYALTCQATCLGPGSWGIGTYVYPGQQFQFNLQLTAPANAGTYRTAWQLTHRGATFGPYLYVDVIVVSVVGPTPTPQPTPSPSPTPIIYSGNVALQASRSPGGTDAVVDENLFTEWAGGHGASAEIDFSWAAPVTIDHIIVWDRSQNSPDNNQINLLGISLSDGTVVQNIDMVSGGPRCADITFSSRTVNWVHIYPWDSSGANGYKEIEIWSTTGPQSSGLTCSNHRSF